MAELPTGTVTFLFTDIEGSTRRWEADPETMASELALHDDVLRSVIEGHGGWVFKHTGDGVCAAFSSAGAALDAAIDAQRVLGLPVRMGVATGEARARDGDYFGPALNRAARVMSAGHGGQILVAASTAALVDGLELVDLGEHRLRDLSGATRLFQVRAQGLETRFAPLRTLEAVPGNLPVQSSSFVGRDTEVKELCELVLAHRLLTLTGVGGVGKTRLAVQVAAELVGEFPDGVWMVELAPVGDPAAVADTAATVLGINPHAGMSVVETVARTLSGRQLLVVDNCEHVLDAAAELVEAIVAHTTNVAVIATSREGLRVGAEHLWAVPSLDTRAGAASAAAELFVERARAVDGGFSLDRDDDSAAVIEICERLDGIALAIELAAARMVSMNPAEVRDRLGDRFRLLSGSRRGLERHQTLRQAVGWSYDLLSDDERMVLMRCAVFAGGFDLTAAMAICGDGRLDEYALLDLVDSLVRKSLMTAEQVLGHTRYGLLETIRQFAEEQLAATSAIAEIRDLHARWFAEQAVVHWDIFDGAHRRASLSIGWMWSSPICAPGSVGLPTMGTWSLRRRSPPTSRSRPRFCSATSQQRGPRKFSRRLLAPTCPSSLASTTPLPSATSPGAPRSPSGTPRPAWCWQPIPATTRSTRVARNPGGRLQSHGRSDGSLARDLRRSGGPVWACTRRGTVRASQHSADGREGRGGQGDRRRDPGGRPGAWQPLRDRLRDERVRVGLRRS